MSSLFNATPSDSDSLVGMSLERQHFMWQANTGCKLQMQQVEGREDVYHRDNDHHQ